jgi:NhaP-type Na+/H+ or K+/H+ antiporter
MFTVLTIEGTFLIRSLFFLVFGYLLETSELFDATTAIWAVAMVLFFLVIRVVQLLLSRLPIRPLLFIAPRGLITILLFLYITPETSIAIVNKSLIIQVIVLTVLVMTFGMMFSESEEKEQEKPLEEDLIEEDLSADSVSPKG